MKPDKLWSALERYDRELATLGYVVQQFEPAQYNSKGPLPPKTMLAHCRWMAQHSLKVFRAEYVAAKATKVYDASDIPEHYEDMFAPLGKAMRWLAYIQGVCNALGVYSCNELRDHSRPDDVPPRTPEEEHGPKTPSRGTPRAAVAIPVPPPPVVLDLPASVPVSSGPLTTVEPTHPADPLPHQQRNTATVKSRPDAVLGFLFSGGKLDPWVALIEKDHPEWQRGKCNGIGGAVEPNETPLEAMVRECQEESGVLVPPDQWTLKVKVHSVNTGYLMWVYTARLANPEKLKDENTSEPCYWYAQLPRNIVPNLKWLVPLCQDDRVQGSMVINYHRPSEDATQPSTEG